MPAIGEVLISETTQYKIVGLQGKGVYSTVVKCVDTKTDIYYAIKIIRNYGGMNMIAAKEAEIVKTLNDLDP